jgi:hypothetical protein
MGTADSSQLETLIKPETLIDWGASASNLPRWPARRAAKQKSGEQDNEHSKDNRTHTAYAVPEDQMTTLTIHSRKLDRDFTFNCNLDASKPNSSRYVRLEENGRTGTDAPQICYGGRHSGNTVSATPATFEHTCRLWYRQHVALLAAE